MIPRNLLQHRLMICRVTGLALVVAGLVFAGTWATSADPDTAQVIRLSGSERSLATLREIKDLLERIDGRLQRMEERMNSLSFTPPASAPVNPQALPPQLPLPPGGARW